MGRIFGIPIYINFSLILLLGLLILFGGKRFGGTGLLLALFLFGSVLLHELGHSLVAHRLGVPIGGITLYPFGGMARMTRMPDSPKDEILISAAGPATSLLAALFFLLLSKVAMDQSPMAAGAGYLVQINLVLGIFNLLPALPMDGGRILRALLSLRHGFVKGTLKASKVATYLGFAMIGAALFMRNFWLVFIAVVVIVLAKKEALVTRVLGERAGYQTSDPTRGTRRATPGVNETFRTERGRGYIHVDYQRGSETPTINEIFGQIFDGFQESRERGGATVTERRPGRATSSTKKTSQSANRDGDTPTTTPAGEPPKAGGESKPYTIHRNPDGSIILNMEE